jgi:hypothetical protein
MPHGYGTKDVTQMKLIRYGSRSLIAIITSFCGIVTNRVVRFPLV